MSVTTGATDYRVEPWKGMADLAIDHYSGLFEMIEQARGPHGAAKVFLLLGQKGVYLVRYHVKSRGLEQQRIADAMSPELGAWRWEAQRESENEVRWAEAFSTCAGLGVDIVILLVGVATGGVGGGALIVWKLAELGPSAIKCTMAYQAWSASVNQRPAWKDSTMGQVVFIAAEVADLGLTTRKIYQGVDRLRRVATWGERFERPAARHLAEAVQWHEGARLALVHLPNLTLKGANLMSLPRTLNSSQLANEIARAADQTEFTPTTLPFLWPVDEVRRWSGLTTDAWNLPFWMPRF
jgi:hypothetical protein